MAERGETKARIYDCALRLFSRDGYAATSMGAIADAVGIRKATLYSHVSGKEELFTALFEQILEEHAAFVARLTAPNQKLSLRDHLLTILRSYVDYNHHSLKMAFWDQCFYSPPEPLRTSICRRTEASTADFIRRLTDLISRAVPQGRSPGSSFSPFIQAQTFYYLMMGFAMSRGINGIEQLLEPCFEVFFRGNLAGFATEPPPLPSSLNR